MVDSSSLLTAQEATQRGAGSGVVFALGIGSTLAGGILLARHQVLAMRSAKKVSVDVTTYNDALSGLHKAVGRVLNSDASEIPRAEFFRAVVDAASRMFPEAGARVCVYELEGAEGNENQPALEVLKYRYSAGRHEEPRGEFTSDTPHGKAAIEAAKGSGFRCVEDARETPDIDRDPGSGWKSFLQVPLQVEGNSLGLLSIDCREPTAFTPHHIGIARASAATVVLGMKKFERAAIDTKPEVAAIQDSLKMFREMSESVSLRRRDSGKS